MPLAALLGSRAGDVRSVLLPHPIAFLQHCSVAQSAKLVFATRKAKNNCDSKATTGGFADRSRGMNCVDWRRGGGRRARPAEGRRADRVCLYLDIDWEIFRLAKLSKPSVLPQTTVRTRRAYFDFKYGQLHVRTAFPGTGGCDEQVTLFFLHSRESSSRSFMRFLPEIAAERSVYAPDLPGFGE